jgi:FAD dependent oxidoreductase
MKPILCVLMGLLTSATAGAADVTEHDLVIYGGTSAAITAAVQASMDGLSVIIVCPETHLGGLSAGGLGATDSGDKSVIGGLSLEFYQRVGRNYHDTGKAQWTFEPHVAERVFEDMVQDHGIKVCRDEWLNRDPGKGVQMDDARIVSIAMLSGETYRGKMFIDATYEGDLLAAAGVSYTVGREANSQYNETLNGVQLDNAVHHQFENDISAYVQPGDPSSGLLPRVSADPPGIQGEADHRVQAYNYRMCLTRDPENRVPFSKPDGYDPAQYELLLRDLIAGARHINGSFTVMPNGKTDTNNNGSFSTDNIGLNYDYPEASYERRREILDEHLTYQRGYCYFLTNDPRVPEDVRAWFGEWGLAKDEFTDNGHWSHQIYVREARRMVGEVVVNENHLMRKIPTPRPIGMGSYNMDSHNVQRYVDKDGFVRNEGDVQINPGGPYPLDYGAIVPKRAECENLLAVCAVSSSHIAYGSIRMEPVFMILGQSAASAARLAIEADIPVQDIEYTVLRARLLEGGQMLP